MGRANIDEVTTHAVTTGLDALRAWAGTRVGKPTRGVHRLART
jgi:hypothetical protein